MSPYKIPGTSLKHRTTYIVSAYLGSCKKSCRNLLYL